MGRGQTATDSFSQVFGNLRGAGLPHHIPGRDDRSPYQAIIDQLGPLGRKVLLAFSHLEGDSLNAAHTQHDVIRRLGGWRKGVPKAVSSLLSLGLIIDRPLLSTDGGPIGSSFYTLTAEGRAIVPDTTAEDEFLERCGRESFKMAPQPLSKTQRQVLTIFRQLGDHPQIAGEIKRAGWNYMAPMRRLKDAGQEVPSRQQVSQIMRRLEERGLLRGRLDGTNLRLYVITDNGRTELTTTP